jgi:hypothetical protein
MAGTESTRPDTDREPAAAVGRRAGVANGPRVPHLTPQEHAARGKAARAEAPRTRHAEWEHWAERPDPIAPPPVQSLRAGQLGPGGGRAAGGGLRQLTRAAGGNVTWRRRDPSESRRHRRGGGVWMPRPRQAGRVDSLARTPPNDYPRPRPMP